MPVIMHSLTKKKSLRLDGEETLISAGAGIKSPYSLCDK